MVGDVEGAKTICLEPKVADQRISAISAPTIVPDDGMVGVVGDRIESIKERNTSCLQSGALRYRAIM